jgi:hypothetical protein
LKDIGKIIRKETGDDVNETPKKDNEKDKEKWLKSLSPNAQAFQMFRERKIFADVVIELDIDTGTVLNYYEDYLILVRTNNFMAIYDELKDDLPILIHLYRRIKKEELTKQDITNLLQDQQRLKDMEKRVDLYLEHIKGQQLQIKLHDQVINTLKSRIDNYNGICILYNQNISIINIFTMLLTISFTDINSRFQQGKRDIFYVGVKDMTHS